MPKANQNERTTIWETMLDTDLSMRYWGKIANREESKDKLAGFIAFMLTIAAAATVGLNLPQWAQVVTTLVSAAVTGVTVFYRFGRASEQAAQMYRMNAEALIQYQDIWNRIDEEDATVVRDVHAGIQRNMIVAGQAAVREFGEDKELAAELQQEVLRERGFAQG